MQIENVSHWNMNSKRMEAQAKWGDILIPIGGAEGVLFLANLYHDAGKPVVPLNLKVTPADQGALQLFAIGLSSAQAPRLFRPVTQSAHAWMNRINFTSRTPIQDQAAAILALLEALEPPPAFVVRLLNQTHADFNDVQTFFDVVVQPIIEGELGYRVDFRRQVPAPAKIDFDLIKHCSDRYRVSLIATTSEPYSSCRAMALFCGRVRARPPSKPALTSKPLSVRSPFQTRPWPLKAIRAKLRRNTLPAFG